MNNNILTTDDEDWSKECIPYGKKIFGINSNYTLIIKDLEIPYGALSYY